MNKDLHFSSSDDAWETPDDLFNELNSLYRFTLDPCASVKNAKCDRYFTVHDNGLSQSWAGERVFMNPPYGRQIKHWVAKAYQEAVEGGALVVCLLPSRTDTTWWHEYCMKANSIDFLRGRVKFSGSKSGAPFPSAIVVFDGRLKK